MNRPNIIILPDRPAETADLTNRHIEVKVDMSKPQGNQDVPQVWGLYDGTASGESLFTPTPYLLSSWLLRTTEQDARYLISPYAKLEINKESRNISIDESGRSGSQYGFRLVSLEVLEGLRESDYEVELQEFKLIAGRNPYIQHDDAAALLTCVAAVHGFNEGRFRLNNVESWERHFSSITD